jgi:hypothetical protein
MIIQCQEPPDSTRTLLPVQARALQIFCLVGKVFKPDLPQALATLWPVVSISKCVLLGLRKRIIESQDALLTR